jgi:AraC-like DNA-binding protein
LLIITKTLPEFIFIVLQDSRFVVYFYRMENAQLQADFFAKLAPKSQIIPLFDLLPGVSFFIKDKEGRFIALSMNKFEHCGVAQEHEAIGKTDHDFFSAQRADAYRADDLAVMESGEAIVNRVESAPESLGSPRLVVTNKIPLYDAAGTIIGVAGFSREIDELGTQPGSVERFAKVIEHIHHHFDEALNSKNLAAMASLSISQFERRFRKAFGASPRQYLMRIRVEAAAKKLAQTDDTVSIIAQDCGFHDHAHFSRSFRKLMHHTPTKYRALHQKKI